MIVKTKDITRSVFNGETEGIIYMIRDDEGFEVNYIFSVPVFSYSVIVRNVDEIDELIKFENGFLGNPTIKKRFVTVLKQMIFDLIYTNEIYYEDK